MKVSLDKGEFWLYCSGCHTFVWSRNSRYIPPHHWEGRQHTKAHRCGVGREVRPEDTLIMTFVQDRMIKLYDEVSSFVLDANNRYETKASG